MNRNQKIALGCGVAGCLGLILIVIIFVVLGVLGYVAMPGSSNRNYTVSGNSNYNSNANTDSSSDTNSNSDTSSSSSSMSEDDKHKLFQAAGITQDSQLILRVLRKIGYPNGSGEGYKEFTDAHAAWALQNMSFIRSVLTPEKARAYVEAHIDD
jgi:hypothetical protein